MTKPCESKFEHIDQTEFEPGRKITSNLLTRFCNNIQKLYSKTAELEDSTDPELRKRFNPPVIHEQHSYGVRLNGDNVYEFDNSTETVFEDGIGRRYITLRNFATSRKNVWSSQLETVENIQEIRDKIKDELYTLKGSISDVVGASGTYYIDPITKTLYIHPLDGDSPVVRVVVRSNEPNLDYNLTTAFVDLEKSEIRAPYTKEMYEKEGVDLNTATDRITTKKDDGGVE